MAQCCRKASDEIIKYWKALDKYEHFKDVDCVELRIIWGESVLAHFKNIRKQWGKMMVIKNDKKTITQDMIQAAKDYPFEELIELKRGYACCPFHEEKNPSFRVKNNKAWCYGCNEGWDTIAFVMKKDGLSFQEAVRRLQS